jgi:hypothetical protein
MDLSGTRHDQRTDLNAMSRPALRKRLDRLVHRLELRDALSVAEARELTALQAEFDGQPPFELMDSAELNAWIREWACGSRGARLDELRRRARTLEEQRADEERADKIASMSPAELDRWIVAYSRANDMGLEEEPPPVLGA